MSIFNKSYLAIILFTATPVLAQDSPEPIGEVITKSVDLTFRKPVKITFELKPEKHLTAGYVRGATPLASFHISTSIPYQVGIRFTPGIGPIGVAAPILTVSGKDNPKNILKVMMVAAEFKNSSYSNGWMVTNSKVNVLNGRLQMNGDQNVAADTYTISMDASAFIS